MAYTDREDLNYLGKLFLIGANQTPFLNMIGGLTGGGKISNAFTFPIAQPWALRAADQSTNVMSEATSISSVTPTTYVRAQDSNTVQIMKYNYGVSLAKQSAFGEISGLAIAGQNQPVVDELDFQRMAALRQMAIDIEFSFLQGTYVAQNLSSTVAKTRGIIEACVTNTVDGGAAALSKAMIKALLLEMASKGGQFVNPVMFVGGFQKQALSDLYGYAPESVNVGGVNIESIYTDFAQIGVVYDPFMPTDKLLIADMSVISPVFCPVNGQVILDQEVAITTAQRGGYLYAQVGLDYGPEEYHGTLVNLKDS